MLCNKLILIVTIPTVTNGVLQTMKVWWDFVWQIWNIKEIYQTLIHELATFILFIIGCTVNSSNFPLPTCFKRQFAKLKFH